MLDKNGFYGRVRVAGEMSIIDQRVASHGAASTSLPAVLQLPCRRVTIHEKATSRGPVLTGLHSLSPVRFQDSHKALTDEMKPRS